jgi:simple sugar transport system ATP-binding protein
MMIGFEPPPIKHEERAPGATMLSVDHLSLPKSHPFATELQDISFNVRAGEIVGLAGVSGNGQQELLAALSGEDQRAAADAILLQQTPAGRLAPGRRRALGFGFVPEERLGRGAVPDMSLADNVLLSLQTNATIRLGFVKKPTLVTMAQAIIERFKVKAAGPQALARSLSGGNLQKYIVGREVMRRPTVLVVAQPTWGVDIGASNQIRAELVALRDAGCALLVISEELDELFEIADRLHVIAKGRLSPSITTADADVALIGQWMSGLWPQETQTTEATPTTEQTTKAAQAAKDHHVQA